MDKIWDRNPSKSEVIGHCGGDEKTEWPRRTDKSRTFKKIKNKEWAFNLLKKVSPDINVFSIFTLLSHLYFKTDIYW